MMFDLTGRVAFVTGSARGLGFEIARAFSEAGATVYINGTDPGRLAEAQARLRQDGVTVEALAVDVSDEAAATKAIDDIVAAQGRFDILVNNVGLRLREPIERIGADDMSAMLDTNVVAAFALAKHAMPLMARGGYGRIVNISSIAGERARVGDLAYIVAKGAMNALTLGLAAECGPYGITCNAILPGTFHTETNHAAFTAPGMPEWFKARVPLQRPGQPAEIGGAAVFLASPAASYVTGVLLRVDGGYIAAG
jgi:gluconate 5-dehydrogenase